MIATSIPYDLVFLIHIIAAVDTLIVFIVMRTSARRSRRAPLSRSSVNASRSTQLGGTRGARLADHGTDHVLTGDKSVSLSKPWIGVGILCYLAIAGHLEARTLPQERALAQAIARDGVARR